MRGHLLGMWLGTGLVGAFGAVAILRFRRALAQAEAELRESQAEQARSAQLAALGTLAAGAAHELATPLTTVAIIAKELTLRLENSEDQSDAQVLREEVDRCREILSQMAVQVGSSPATSAAAFALDELLKHALHGGAQIPPVRLELLEALVRVPKDLMAQVSRSLGRNAQQASGPGQSVLLQVQAHADHVVIRIQDQGHGMSPQVLERATQPFFTTKEPGEGMGLGLFVADSVLRQLGGTLTLESAPEQGSTATLSLPSETP
jgi:two-component system sensor histidine kinase RegB